MVSLVLEQFVLWAVRAVPNDVTNCLTTVLWGSLARSCTGLMCPPVDPAFPLDTPLCLTCSIRSTPLVLTLHVTAMRRRMVFVVHCPRVVFVTPFILDVTLPSGMQCVPTFMLVRVITI